MKELVKIVVIFGGLIWFFEIAEPQPHWAWFFIIIAAGNIIPDVLFPRKRKTKKRTAKRNDGKKEQTKSATTRKRSDNEIVTAKLNELDGYEFERLIALYFKEKGYKAQIVGGAGDHEVDIILTDPRDNSKIAVQCKHWKTKNVGNDTILRLSAGKTIHKCQTAWCITTSDYTKSAKEAAEGLNIRLINGVHVEESMGKWQKQKRQKVKLKTKKQKDKASVLP